MILSIETSCDETAIAILDHSGKTLSSVITTQIPIHQKYGGVVPEIASRNHAEAIYNVAKQAVTDAEINLSQITSVAATTHPGLAGSVMVGKVFGESLANALSVPFIPINHLAGHIATAITPSTNEPFLCLLVSGGHTSLYITKQTKGGWSSMLLEETSDDAVGEAFDKVAKILGLPYPGGPSVSKMADMFTEDTELISFVKKPNYAKSGFSYSGLKTAVLNYVNREKQRGEKYDFELDIPHISASFQDEACRQLVYKCIKHLKATGIRTLGVVGGVSANNHLRKVLKTECNEIGVKATFPPLDLCGDNAVMIGLAAIFKCEIN